MVRELIFVLFSLPVTSKFDGVVMDETQDQGIDRRSFLKLGAGSAALGLFHLQSAFSPTFAGEVASGTRSINYASTEDLYRSEWSWDAVTWGSHTNQCAPGGCSFRVYTKNGVIWREEQSGRSYASNSDYPDYNPQGCQKGCGFHNTLTTPERVKYPLKRVGERGAGKWQRVSWDEALTEVADAILDAHENHGTESVIVDAPHIHSGSVGLAATSRFISQLNGLTIDLNVSIGDDLKGIGQTFGKMAQGYTADNFFDAELIILTHSNISYTWPPTYHFVTEARYNGSEVVVISPDYNPTALTADIHIPVNVASDAAFWLAICQVIIEEDMVDVEFVREQTDLAILVRKDNGRYLRASEVSGGKDEQLYFFDEKRNSIVEAPRGTLSYEGDQALDGNYPVQLSDGSTVEVTPVYALLKSKLNTEYTPEIAREDCGVHPDVIRQMARKVATKRTCSYIGFTSGKHYHGDLMERSLILSMALTGNWGKPGTGFNCFLVPDVGIGKVATMDQPVDPAPTPAPGSPTPFDMLRKKFNDPDLTDEILMAKMAEEGSKLHGTVPPVFFLYNHAGYDKLWDKPEWNDPTLKKTFGEYMKESIDREFWDEHQIKPAPDRPPKVMMLIANNPLRRNRSARKNYVEDLFPKLDMLFAIEPKMSASAAFCDIVLPAAWYYEKDDMTMTFGLNPYTALIEKAVEPPGEAKPEWEIFSLLMDRISTRATQRKMVSFMDRRGKERLYAELSKRFTVDGFLETQMDALNEMVNAAEAMGSFPKGFNYEKFRELGQVRIHGGVSSSTASDVDPGKPFYSLAKHLDDKQVYPTYARRAQFYIDHEWFIEAGEAFPVHKDTPPIGGNHPFKIVSGHVRGSIHSMHSGTPDFLKLHRGQPLLFINDKVAKERGINDADMVRMFNDVDESELMACVSSSVGPDQVVIYMFESWQFKDWKSHDAMLVGLPKSLQLAGDYEQLAFRQGQGSPSPANDRGLRVDIALVRDRVAGTDEVINRSENI
jgi:DMSO reductase family type II enzyme molybdopterin subunit